MSKTHLRPTTLTGIKTLAHDLKVHAKVSHTAGLNAAANLAGYANYQAARNYLGTAAEILPARRFPLYISIWWRDSAKNTSGRETMRIDTQRPLDEIMPLKLMAFARYLSGMKRAGPDHIAWHSFYASQAQARLEVAGAARTIAFIEVTGLVPTSKWKMEYPKGNSNNVPPGKDHTGLWFDPEAMQYIVTDEPYVGEVDTLVVPDDRAAWAARWGRDMRAVTWGGMYYPDGGTRLFMHTDALTNYDLAGVVARLDALPEPVGSEIWTGESASHMFDFITPATVVEQAMKLAAKKARVPVPRGPRNSVSTGGGRSRPAKRLDLSLHSRMGELLKAALQNSGYGSPAGTRINLIRSRLEDWMFGEFGADLDGDAFFRVYYKDLQDRSLLAGSEEQKHKAHLQIAEVRSILSANYPDSAPLRQQLSRIDRVQSLLSA